MKERGVGSFVITVPFLVTNVLELGEIFKV